MLLVLLAVVALVSVVIRDWGRQWPKKQSKKALWFLTVPLSSTCLVSVTTVLRGMGSGREGAVSRHLVLITCFWTACEWEKGLTKSTSTEVLNTLDFLKNVQTHSGRQWEMKYVLYTWNDKFSKHRSKINFNIGYFCNISTQYFKVTSNQVFLLFSRNQCIVKGVILWRTDKLFHLSVWTPGTTSRTLATWRGERYHYFSPCWTWEQKVPGSQHKHRHLPKEDACDWSFRILKFLP